MSQDVYNVFTCCLKRSPTVHAQIPFDPGFVDSRSCWYLFDIRSNFILILIIKLRCTNFSNLFLEQNCTCLSFSVYHQESSTVHIALGVCHTVDADCLLASSHHHLYGIYLLLCVQCQTPDDGQKNCPRHGAFYSKNKFEKLVHLIDFIIRIYRDARSSECHIFLNCLMEYGQHVLLIIKWNLYGYRIYVDIPHH